MERLFLLTVRRATGKETEDGRFQKDNRTFLAFETDRASFEYEYGI